MEVKEQARESYLLYYLRANSQFCEIKLQLVIEVLDASCALAYPSLA